MELTPQQQNKVLKVAKFIDNHNVASMEAFIEVEDKLNSLEEQLNNVILEIQSIEMPEQKDHTAHMEKMMEMMNEPLDITVDLNII